MAAGDFGRDIHYRTRNLAGYLENVFRLTPRWSLIPGVRLEHGRTKMDGRLAYYDPADVPTRVEHDFPLFGVRTQYRLPGSSEAYAGWSQAYRPMILKDVLPESAIERTDPDLEDARGWTLEAGVRGSLGRRLAYDLSAFTLRYDNRLGGLLQVDSLGASYLFKTNVGSTRTHGVEVAAEGTVVRTRALEVRVFTATAYFDARYRDGSVAVSGQNVSVAGNQVESVPRWITRNGVTLAAGTATATGMVSHVARAFADPQNTVDPTPNGARGVVPAYTVVDLNASAGVTRWLRLRVGVNNLLDRKYFTKRPTFYPGPGIWPSDGRSVQVSLGATP
mgnify:CR=1 FL=1